MRRKFLTTIFILFGALLPVTPAFAAPEDEQVEVTDQAEGSEDSEGSDGSDVYQSQYTGFDGYDIGYSGPIDIVSGQPVEEGGDDDNGGELVRISDGVNFDRFSQRYIFSVGNARVLSSVADGMTVTDKVILSKDGEMNLAVYHDGESMDEIPAEITDPGEYVVTTWTDNSKTQLLSFQIVNSVTGMLKQYNLPVGFTVDKVVRDGQTLSHGNTTVEFKEEGEYIVDYSCTATSVEYTLKVRIDHTPPAITFGGLDENDEARGPVTVEGLEEGDKIVIIFGEDEEVTLDDDNQVSETGYYHVTVTDAAGNTIEKEFRILLYLNFNATLFIVAFVLVIAGVIIALKVSRKRLRVR